MTFRIAAIAFVASFAGISNAATLFDFFDGTGDTSGNLDPGGVGATMSAVDPSGAIVTLTTIDILAPEYQTVGGVTSATGLTLSALAGDPLLTNINGNADAIGINNPSVTNNEYDSLGSGDGAEANDFNVGETWVFSFNFDVMLDQIEIESNQTTELGSTLSVAIGTAPPTVLSLPTAGDFLVNPLSNTLIGAGTPISFTAGGDFETDFRIESITVSIPEPSRGILLFAGLSLPLLRRRKGD